MSALDNVGTMNAADGEWIAHPTTQIEVWVAAGMSRERAFRRATRQQDGELRIIRFFPDHGNPWPLWESDAEDPTPTPDVYGLSGRLVHDMREWYDTWESGFRFDSGWVDASAGREWNSRGDDIADRLQAEVWDFAEVSREHRRGHE